MIMEQILSLFLTIGLIMGIVIVRRLERIEDDIRDFRAKLDNHNQKK